MGTHEEMPEGIRNIPVRFPETFGETMSDSTTTAATPVLLHGHTHRGGGFVGTLLPEESGPIFADPAVAAEALKLVMDRGDFSIPAGSIVAAGNS